MEDELTGCQRKLAQLKQDFDQFVYLVSHDLNAPIRAITNLSEWIAEDLGNDIPVEVKQHVDLLQNRTRRLEEMLQAILNLSRVGRTDLDKNHISVPDFLQNICNKYQNEMVAIDIQTEPIELVTYSQKLKTVLEELISNGIKHAENKLVQLQIKVNMLPHFLKISITDNGPGIKAEVKDKIFQIFYTARGKEANINIGAGLALVKHITEFVGGSITVEDNTPAPGSTFILQWPIVIGEEI